MPANTTPEKIRGVFQYNAADKDLEFDHYLQIPCNKLLEWAPGTNSVYFYHKHYGLVVGISGCTQAELDAWFAKHNWKPKPDHGNKGKSKASISWRAKRQEVQPNDNLLPVLHSIMRGMVEDKHRREIAEELDISIQYISLLLNKYPQTMQQIEKELVDKRETV